jgi:hypothetical protein
VDLYGWRDECRILQTALASGSDEAKQIIRALDLVCVEWLDAYENGRCGIVSDIFMSCDHVRRSF